MTLKILLCVLYSESPEYAEMYQATRWYYKQFSHVRVFYYCFREKQETDYVLGTETDILYIRGTENIIPGMLEKTVSAYKYIAEHFDDYHFVIRTNVSTVLNMAYLTSVLEQYPMEYGGAKASVLSYHYRDIPSGIDNSRLENTIYPFGVMIVFRMDFFRKFVSLLHKIDYTITEDVATGRLISKYLPNTFLVCFAPHILEVDILRLSTIDYAEYIIYRNKQLRREQDIISIRHIVRVLSLQEFKTNAPIVQPRILSLKYLIPPTASLHTANTNIYACVSRYNTNTDWTARLWNVSRVLVYDKENLDNPYNIPVNKGNEASVYLKYIIDHYHCLPDFTFFVHDDEFAWHHSGSVVDKLTEAVESGEKYYNINDRCILGSILTNELYPFVLKWYRIYVDKYIPLASLPNPDWTRGYRGSAQFLVHKSRILGLPLSFYQELYDWITTTDAHSYITGRCLEWTWHLFWEKYPYIANTA